MSFVVLITDTKTYWDEENDWNLLGLLLCQPRQVIPESLWSGRLLIDKLSGWLGWLDESWTFSPSSSGIRCTGGNCETLDIV